MDQIVQPPLDVVLRLWAKRAHGADQSRIARNHAHRRKVARVHRAQAHHRRVERAHVARDDRLRGSDDVAGDEHGVNRQMRMGAVTTTSFDMDLDPIGRRHHRAWSYCNAAWRQAGPVVQSINFIGGKAFEQTVFDHRLTAGEALLTWLKDEINGAVEPARTRQIARGAEQHGGVPVVAAAVHPALEARHVREVVLLVHRQRIHVRAQADATSAVLTLAANHADDTGLTDARVVRDPEHIELAGHDFGRAMLLEAKLGMRVQIAPQRGELGVLLRDVLDWSHEIDTQYQWAVARRSMRRRGSTA